MPHSGKYYEKVAKQNKLEVRKGKGDHVNVYGPAGRGYMTIPLHKELSKGVECKVNGWFKALGILVVVAIIAVGLVIINNFASVMIG